MLNWVLVFGQILYPAVKRELSVVQLNQFPFATMRTCKCSLSSTKRENNIHIYENAEMYLLGVQSLHVIVAIDLFLSAVVCLLWVTVLVLAMKSSCWTDGGGGPRGRNKGAGGHRHVCWPNWRPANWAKSCENRTKLKRNFN